MPSLRLALAGVILAALAWGLSFQFMRKAEDPGATIDPPSMQERSAQPQNVDATRELVVERVSPTSSTGPEGRTRQLRVQSDTGLSLSEVLVKSDGPWTRQAIHDGILPLTSQKPSFLKSPGHLEQKIKPGTDQVELIADASLLLLTPDGMPGPRNVRLSWEGVKTAREELAEIEIHGSASADRWAIAVECEEYRSRFNTADLRILADYGTGSLQVLLHLTPGLRAVCHLPPPPVESVSTLSLSVQNPASRPSRYVFTLGTDRSTESLVHEQTQGWGTVRMFGATRKFHTSCDQPTIEVPEVPVGVEVLASAYESATGHSGRLHFIHTGRARSIRIGGGLIVRGRLEWDLPDAIDIVEVRVDRGHSPQEELPGWRTVKRITVDETGAFELVNPEYAAIRVSEQTQDPDHVTVRIRVPGCTEVKISELIDNEAVLDLGLLQLETSAPSLVLPLELDHSDSTLLLAPVTISGPEGATDATLTSSVELPGGQVRVFLDAPRTSVEAADLLKIVLGGLPGHESARVFRRLGTEMHAVQLVEYTVALRSSRTRSVVLGWEWSGLVHSVGPIECSEPTGMALSFLAPPGSIRLWIDNPEQNDGQSQVIQPGVRSVVVLN